MWRKTSLKADVWGTELGLRNTSFDLSSTGYGCSAIPSSVHFGGVLQRELPIIPFTEGLELSEIPQTEEDKIFAREDLVCRNGIYEEISHREVQEKKVEGKMISSAFVVWQGEGEERKGRFVIKFHKQSQHSSRGSVRMESLPSFAVELQQNDTLLSLDIKSGYRHFYLHPTCGIILYSVTRGATIAA